MKTNKEINSGRIDPLSRKTGERPRGENPAVLGQILGGRVLPARPGSERRPDVNGKALSRTRILRGQK